MLSDTALTLLRDVTGRPEMFAQAHRIRRRIVAWGGEEPKAFEHSAAVISEQQLLDELRRGLLEQENSFRPNWLIDSAKACLSGVKQHRFGNREASAQRVVLRRGVDPATCWIEALKDGWLFLIPNSEECGWLLTVGGERLPEASRIVADQIRGYGAKLGRFPAYPRVASPLGGSHWLACGTAAMSFDPLCGDGTAHAVREAILATAIIRAREEGEAMNKLLVHYEARMLAGFARHLQMCRDFYRNGFGGAWWDQQADALEIGLQWCGQRSPDLSVNGYWLNGFQLEAAS
jgi:hypothetical protein